jgi:hypothetical protein
VNIDASCEMLSHGYRPTRSDKYLQNVEAHVMRKDSRSGLDHPSVLSLHSVAGHCCALLRPGVPCSVAAYVGDSSPVIFARKFAYVFADPHDAAV